MICAIVGCPKRSDRDKDVSFYRIPAISTGRGPRELLLTTKCRTGYIAIVSRDDFSESAVSQARICSRHFISGRPAYLYNELHPDWLPTRCLGHSKRVHVSEDRYARKKVRYARKKARYARAQLSDTASVSTVNDGSCEKEV